MGTSHLLQQCIEPMGSTRHGKCSPSYCSYSCSVRAASSQPDSELRLPPRCSRHSCC